MIRACHVWEGGRTYASRAEQHRGEQFGQTLALKVLLP